MSTPHLRSITELEKLATESRELGKQAIMVHQRAQDLNKQGEFEAAMEAYAEMHRLEDLSISLATQAGCVSCVLGGDETNKSSDIISMWDQSYEILHEPCTFDSLVSTEEPLAPSVAPSNIIRERAIGCIVSSSIADAAATGVHWVYDLSLLRSIERDLPAPQLEFLNPPRSPFYAYEVGRNSPYGEQMLVLLDSLARSGGVDCRDYLDAFSSAFAPEGFEGYRDQSTKGTLRNLSLGILPPGANDAQANCITRLAPLVAMYCGDPMLPVMVEVTTRCTQNSDTACAWGLAGARVLERLMLDPLSSDRDSQPVRRAVVSVIKELESDNAGVFFGLGGKIASHLKKALDLCQIDPLDASLHLGNNCHMPNALTSPLQIVLYLESSPLMDSDPRGAVATFREGVRVALRQGGCCASRCSYLGAILGILLAPMMDQEWLLQVRDRGVVESNATKIARARD